MPWNLDTVMPAAGAILIPNIGGCVLSGLLVRPQLHPWYSGLKKPSWRPPNWAFGPVWTTLYSGMGYGSYLVYKHGNGFNGPAKIPLMLYGTQLILNWAWTPIFFGTHKLKLAFYEILALDAAVVATAYAFFNVDTRAGLTFVPYMMWLGIATALSYRVYKDNPDEGATITEEKDN